MLEVATRMEPNSVKVYNEWAKVCAQNSDLATKKIFEALVDNEERHLGQYDKKITV